MSLHNLVGEYSYTKSTRLEHSTCIIYSKNNKKVSKKRKIEEEKYDDIVSKELSMTKTSNENRTKESRKQTAIEKTKSINHNTFGNEEKSEQENMEYNDLGDNDSIDTSARTVWRDASDFGPNPADEDYEKQIDITNSDDASSTDRGSKQNRGFNCHGRKEKQLPQLKFVSDDDESDDGARKSDLGNVFEKCPIEKEIPVTDQNHHVDRKMPKVRKVEIFQPQARQSGSSINSPFKLKPQTNQSGRASIAAVSQTKEINSTANNVDDNNNDDERTSQEEMTISIAEYEMEFEKMKKDLSRKNKELREVRKIVKDFEELTRKLKDLIPSTNDVSPNELQQEVTDIPKPQKGDTKTFLFGKAWDYENVLKAISSESLNGRIVCLMNALWPDKATRIKFVVKKKKNCNPDLIEIPYEDLVAIKSAAESLDVMKTLNKSRYNDMADYKKIISNVLKCERLRYEKKHCTEATKKK